MPWEQKSGELANLDTTEPSTLQYILMGIAEQARRALKATAVTTCAEDIGTLQAIAPGKRSYAGAYPRLLVGRSLHELVVSRKSPIIIDQVSNDTTIPSRDRSRLLRHDYQSLLGVPMLAFERSFGAFFCLSERRRKFKVSEVRLLNMFATHAAMVIENSRLSGEIRRKTEELKEGAGVGTSDNVYEPPFFYDLRNELHIVIGHAELLSNMVEHENLAVKDSLDTLRNHARLLTGVVEELPEAYSRMTSRILREEDARVARELHDGLSQELGLLWLTLARLHSLPKLDTAKEQIRLLQTLAGTAYDDVSHFLNRLNTGLASQKELLPTFERYLCEFSENHEIRVEWRLDSACADFLGTRTLLEVIKIAQEALSNVRKHSRAKHCMVILNDEGHVIRLVVKDDGQGFETRAAARLKDFCHGLAGMRQRARLVGGSLTLRSRPQAGTEISVRIPK